MIHPSLATLAIIVAMLAPPAHTQIVGRASVIDGDTIAIHGRHIRLFGIDAPEARQLCEANGERWRCGHYAALALADKIGTRPVSCVQKDRDRYGRIVAVCRVSGVDLDAWLVAQGWAVAYRHYSTAYVPEEEAARKNLRRIWRGRFVPPWEWRRGKRLDVASEPVPRSHETTSPATGEHGKCNIKGNISYRTGERIYHVPGGEYYDATRIDPSRGERWFCSEAEARAAGWRKSKR